MLLDFGDGESIINDNDSDPDYISPSISDYESNGQDDSISELCYELQPVPIHNPNASDAMENANNTNETNFYENNILDKAPANVDSEKNDPIFEHNYVSQNVSQTSCMPPMDGTGLNPYKPQNISGRRKRKHCCVYCDLLVNNFARHLKRQHSDEIEVQKFLSMEMNNPKRKQFIDKIRKEGDFCSGKLIPVQEKKIKVNTKSAEEDNSESEEDKSTCELLPCTHCRGYYARKTLRRHVKRCHFNKKTDTSKRTRPQGEGHTLMADHFGPNDPLRTSGVLKTLKPDEISLVAKRDKIICEVGRKYIKSHREKHLSMVARRYMRRLARLLIEIRKIENNKSLSLLSILHPSKFRAIVQATRSICSYDSSSKTFKTPSLALQMGTMIKKAISAAYSIEIQKNVESPILNILNSFRKLIEEEWAIEVSTEAGQNLNLNRFNKPTLMPMAEDISKMKNYLDELILNAKNNLKENCKNEEAYKKLIEGTYCSLLLFNKRRVGELQRILLDTYLKVPKNQPSGEFEKLLSPTEKILINKLKRIVIRGKRGRGVPVLFDKVTQEGLDLTIQHRNNFFETHNPYLFGVCHSESCISGYHVFRKHVNQALGDQNKTATLTSTKLRKHLATISQILKMGNEDLEQLATFMGHTTKTHNEWYRLPSDIYQTAKVSKILLLAQNNTIDKYKGCKLDELDIEGDIMEMEDTSSTDEDEGGELQVENSVHAEETETGSYSGNTFTRKKKIKTIKKWTSEEKHATKNFFKNHIKKKIAPKKNEVMKLVELHPLLFKDRKWDSIKVFVCNQYAKQ